MIRSTPQKAFKADIDIIIAEILKLIGNLDITIILYGGYGRDEGGWINIDGCYFPYNDYDILIITNSKLRFKKSWLITKLENKLLSLIKIKFIDISIYEVNKLKRLKNSVFNVDLIKASKIIYGDKNIFENINYLDESKIAIREAELLFFTRAWVFSGGISKYQKDTMFALTQLSKAIFAIIDGHLIANNKYTSLYKDKIINFKELASTNVSSKFFKLVEWAYLQRLSPTSIFNAKDLSYQEAISEVRILYRGIFLELFSKKYKIKFTTIRSYVIFNSYMSRSILGKFLRFLPIGYSIKKAMYQKIIFGLNLSYQLGEIDILELESNLGDAYHFFQLKENDAIENAYLVADKL